MSRHLEAEYIRILDFIVQHEQTTYKQIGNKFDLSEKTVKKYISHINDYLKRKEMPIIEVKQGKGITYDVKRKDIEIFE